MTQILSYDAMKIENKDRNIKAMKIENKNTRSVSCRASSSSLVSVVTITLVILFDLKPVILPSNYGFL